MEMPKGWQTLKIYRNKANDESKYTWAIKMDQALDIIKEMAEVLELYAVEADELPPGYSLSAKKILKKFKDWK